MNFIINGTYYENSDPLPGCLEVPQRPSPSHVWENGSWAIPLADAQAAQTVVLRAACDAAITRSFVSSALGAARTYPGLATDQANMQQTAATVVGGLLMCADAAGAWSLVSHDQAQATQVLADFVAWRDKQRSHLASLIAQVQAATTVEAVQAIVW